MRLLALALLLPLGGCVADPDDADPDGGAPADAAAPRLDAATAPDAGPDARMDASPPDADLDDARPGRDARPAQDGGPVVFDASEPSDAAVDAAMLSLEERARDPRCGGRRDPLPACTAELEGLLCGRSECVEDPYTVYHECQAGQWQYVDQDGFDCPGEREVIDAGR